MAEGAEPDAATLSDEALLLSDIRDLLRQQSR
jgi:large-conductance mechanosensitive channel